MATSIARLADFTQHGIDTVAIGERIAEPLQDDHAQALAKQGAVAALFEGTHLAPPAQGAELAEDHRHFGRQRGVHAPGEHQLAATGAQFVHRRRHGQQ